LFKKYSAVSAFVLLGLTACNGETGGVPTTHLTGPGGTETTGEISTVIPSNTSSGTDPKTDPTPVPSPTPTPSPTTNTTDLYTGPAEIAKYVQKFIDDAKIQGVDVVPDMKGPKLTIQIAGLSNYGSSVIGLCESGTNLRRVTLNPSFWNSVNDTQKELLVHHELGHCVLYRGHDTSTTASGAVDSIMYPVIMSSSTYLNNYAHYQVELFTMGASAPRDPNQNITHTCTPGELSH